MKVGAPLGQLELIIPLWNEAKNLPKHDKRFFLTKSSIDAFVKITIGQYKFKTHIQKSLHPKWYETFEIPIEESNTQQIQVDYFINLKSKIYKKRN